MEKNDAAGAAGTATSNYSIVDSHSIYHHPGEVDFAEAERFLAFLDNKGARFHFRTFDDSEAKRPSLTRKITGDFDVVKNQLAELNRCGAGVFVVVNEGGHDDVSITHIRAVFEDQDRIGMTRPNYALEPQIEIESSPGKTHRYWLVEGLPVERFKPFQQAIASKFESDKSVCNPSRVMRLPGFIHRKGKPFLVRIIAVAETPPYSASQIQEAFPLTDKLSRPARIESKFIREGSRNSTLASLAGSMRRRGMGEDAILAALLVENERCEPPLDKVEVSNIAKSIAKYPPEPESNQEATELAVAHQLRSLFSGDIRYIAERGTFVFWDGHRWILDGDGVRIHNAYELLLRHEMQAATNDSDIRRGLDRTTALKRLQSRRVIDNVIALLKRLDGVPIKYDEFDSNPELFQVQNGVMDLKTGDFRPAIRDDLCLLASSVVYDPNADCPNWKRFLSWAMNSDVSKVEFLQRLFGYFMWGHALEEILPIFHGGGANGKSTVREVIRRLLGEYAAVAPPSLLVERDKNSATNDIARLAGVRAVFVSETDENDKLAESTVKYLTQQEKIAARYLYCEHFEFIPRFKCCLATNHRPVVRGSDDGIWRRLLLIPFENRVPDNERDVHFVEKRLIPELPGIFNWLVSGAYEYCRNGLKIPQSIKAATATYREKSDIFTEWFDDCLETDSRMFLRNSEIWFSFKNWHRLNHGDEPPRCFTPRGLGRWLSDKGYQSEKQNGNRGYQGLRVRPDVCQ